MWTCGNSREGAAQSRGSRRELALERAEHRRVVREARLHIQPADDVKLLRQSIACWFRFREHLLQRVPIRAVFLGQTRVATEDTGLPQHAHVRGIDVLVRGERHAVAVLRAIHCVSERSNTEQIGRVEQGQGVRIIQPLASTELFGDRAKRRVRQTVHRQVERSAHDHFGITP